MISLLFEKAFNRKVDDRKNLRDLAIGISSIPLLHTIEIKAKALLLREIPYHHITKVRESDWNAVVFDACKKSHYPEVVRKSSSYCKVTSLFTLLVLIGPFAEEWAFRDLLHRKLLSPSEEKKGDTTIDKASRIAISSFLFSMWHYQPYLSAFWNRQMLLSAGLSGLAWGAMMEVTGSILASTISHAGYNGAIFCSLWQRAKKR